MMEAEITRHFQDFDNQFTAEEIQSTRRRWLYTRVKNIHEVQTISHWTFPVGQHSQDKVQNAVYVAQGYYVWQMFRVAMKGLSIREKLFMLAERYNCYIDGDEQAPKAQLEKIRIDNYIGALRRGGFLDADYKIIKG